MIVCTLHVCAHDINFVCVCALVLPYFSGKLPVHADDDDDSQQVFTKTALELPQQEEERVRINKYNHYQDESLPPLPPKPLAG